MRKHEGEYLEPDEFYIATRDIVNRLSELALFLNVQKPAGLEEFGRLSRREVMDLFITSRASSALLQEQWEIEADKLIAQALETGVVFPVSSDPKS